MNVEIDEGQRQMILCALALTTLLRPGWEYACGEIADVFHGREMFELFRRNNRDQVKPTP
jgi:hypothetical protein